MKLSELTYEYLQSLGLSQAHMHTDASDSQRYLYNEYQFEAAKQELMSAYGDVNIIINPDADWFDRIKIDDAKWQADHKEFCQRKAEWCNKYGCD